jgi:hypothetical protein
MLKNYMPRIALLQSHYMTWALLFACLLLAGTPVFAEGGCPSGYVPSGVGPGGVQGCAPMSSGQGGTAAPSIEWADRWGAIASDFGAGSIGMAKGLASQSKAKNAAIEDCEAKGGHTCKIEIAYRNQCAALVVGDNIHNTNAGLTENEAAQKGITMCSASDQNCHVYYSACSLPERVR